MLHLRVKPVVPEGEKEAPRVRLADGSILPPEGAVVARDAHVGYLAAQGIVEIIERIRSEDDDASLERAPVPLAASATEPTPRSSSKLPAEAGKAEPK